MAAWVLLHGFELLQAHDPDEARQLVVRSALVQGPLQPRPVLGVPRAQLAVPRVRLLALLRS